MPSAKRAGIAVAGSILVDHIYEIAAYPQAGELTKILSCKKAAGGCVPNVAVDLKRLSPQTPIYAMSLVGEDEDGAFLREMLRGNGVDATGLRTGAQRTSFTDVMSVVGGQRTFFTYAGACAEFGVDSLDLESTDAAMLHLGYFLLLDRVDAGDGTKILKRAKELGIKTSIDLVSENSDRYACVLPALPYTDNLIVNELEAGKLCGIEPTMENLRAICEKLMQMGVRERVILHMPACGVCLSKEGFTLCPSFEPPKGYIKGKTGAGDAFCAGALLGIAQGLGDAEIMELGGAAAILSMSVADATSGMCEAEKALALCRPMARTEL